MGTNSDETIKLKNPLKDELQLLKENLSVENDRIARIINLMIRGQKYEQMVWVKELDEKLQAIMEIIEINQ